MVENAIKPDLSVKIGKLKLKNPIITASGTFGYADEYEEFINLNNIGAVITKGITLKPTTGNPQPRIKEVKGGLINTIGLENIGIYAFIEQKLPILINKDITFIINIAGSTLNEYIELASICEANGIKAIELNLSCPNVEHGCLEFGRDENTLYKLLYSVRQVYTNTLIVKLGSNVSDPAKLAQIIEKTGADAISAINTIKSMHLNIAFNNGKFDYSYIKGGLSGPVIKPVALSFINEIRQSSNIPIIGMGGISNLNDIFEFMLVGSNAVQIGTANFTNQCISEQLAIDLENWLISHENKESERIIVGADLVFARI